MKKKTVTKETKEKKIIRFSAPVLIGTSLACPPLGAILIGIDKHGDKLEMEQKKEESRKLDELIESSKVKKIEEEDTPTEEE